MLILWSVLSIKKTLLRKADMSDERIIDIEFDRSKREGLEFDIIPLEEFFTRMDLNPSPYEPHRVEFYLLLIITEGEGLHTIDFKDYTYRAGSVLSIRKNKIHQFHKGNAKGFMVLFTEEYSMRFLQEKEALKTLQIFNEWLGSEHLNLSPKELGQLLVLIKEIRYEIGLSSDRETASILRNFLQILINRFYRIKFKNHAKVNDEKYVPEFIQLQSLIETHCHHTRSVTFYADKMALSPRSLNNITQHILGKSIKSLIDYTVVLQIKRMLINSPLHVKEIAYQMGFNEPSNLFKFFKRYTHQTPEEFRKIYSI